MAKMQPSKCAIIVIFAMLSLVLCGPIEDAGCHTTPYISDKNVGVVNDHAAVMLPNTSTCIAYSSSGTSIEYPGTACNWASFRLRVKVCSPDEKTTCHDVDICRITKNLPNSYTMYIEEIYDIVVGSSKIYILTRSDDSLQIYSCDFQFKGCSMNSPYTGKGDNFKATYDQQLYIAFGESNDNTIIIKCEPLATVCSAKNMNFIANEAPVGAPFPVPTIIGDKLHIATFRDDTITVYTCDKNINSCHRAQTMTGKLHYGVTSDFNVAIYSSTYYISYHNYAGPCTDIAIGTCNINIDNTLGKCSNGHDNIPPPNDIDTADGDGYACGSEILGGTKPGIGFASYLGSIIVASPVTSASQLAVYMIDLDMLKDTQTYVRFDVGKLYLTTNFDVFDINEYTGLVRMIGTVSHEEDASSYVHIFDVDMFPSQRSNLNVLTYSAGYGGYYPPHGVCHGLFADEILTCTSRKSAEGGYVQKVIISGGDFEVPKIEDQPCATKILRKILNVYPRGSNPHSSNACVGQIQKYSYFDDGPSIPIIGRKISDYILGLLAHESSIIYWRGGVLHDWCYHNTIQKPGYDKDNCDKLALDTWIYDCTHNKEKKDLLGQIIDDMLGPVAFIFDIIGALTCEGLAYAYYEVLHSTSVADGAYYATNSKVIVPSDYVDGPLTVSVQWLTTIGDILSQHITLVDNTTLVFDPDIITSEINALSKTLTPVPAKKPTTKRPVSTKKPVRGKPVPAKKPTTKRPVSTKKPVKGKPVLAKKPTTKRSVSTKKPIKRKPVKRKPQKKKPVKGKPKSKPAHKKG